MQKNLLGDSIQQEDTFDILKNYRKKIIRPKAKYVRKAPFCPRKLKRIFNQNQNELKDHKNQRKMTADSDIQLDLMEKQNEVQIQRIQQFNSFGDIQKADSFFQVSNFLQFILPLESNDKFGKKFEVQEQERFSYMDFFNDQ